MSKKPFVSIIIDNYNYERFLPEAIESALRQTYRQIEVIVVDDGSKDNSRSVIEKYGDRIRPVFKENGGQASAFNAGFRASKGDWVCFLDADDTWLSTKVEEVVKQIEKHPDAVLIYHTVQKVSSEGKPTDVPIPTTLLQGDIADRVARTGGWWPYPPTSALSFRRDYLERVMDIPEELYRLCADAYLADLAPFVGTVVGIDKPLAFYRLHGTNQWNDSKRLQGREAALRSHAKHYEMRVQGLNEALQRLQIPRQVRLEEHWPYQRAMHKLGGSVGWLRISKMALDFPVETSKKQRVKNLLKFWLESIGVER